MAQTKADKGGGAVSFDRSLEDMFRNAPIPLFEVGGKRYAVPLRMAGEVDAWLDQAQELFDTLGMAMDRCQTRMNTTRVMLAGLVDRQAQAEATAEATAEPVDGDEPVDDDEPAGNVVSVKAQEAKKRSVTRTVTGTVTEAQVAEVRTRYQDAAQYHREAQRRFYDAMLDCVCAYAPDTLDAAVLREQGITDAQAIYAFGALRQLSDPLAMQLRISGLLNATQLRSN